MGRGWSEQRRGEAGEAKGADFEPTVVLLPATPAAAEDDDVVVVVVRRRLRSLRLG